MILSFFTVRTDLIFLKILCYVKCNVILTVKDGLAKASESFICTRYACTYMELSGLESPTF